MGIVDSYMLIYFDSTNIRRNSVYPLLILKIPCKMNASLHVIIFNNLRLVYNLSYICTHYVSTHHHHHLLLAFVFDF